MDDTKALPSLGNVAAIFPVLTTISFPLSRTSTLWLCCLWRGVVELMDPEAVMVYSLDGESVAARACPVHLSEPSGQNAVAQDSKFALPEAVKVVAFDGCCPFPQGNPNVTPDV